MRRVTILICTLLGVCSSAKSADILIDNEDNCSLYLTGEIRDGDSKAFAKLAGTIGLLDAKIGDYIFNEMNDAVCLNSPGGSWEEGWKIAQKISEFGVTTRVLAGDACLSACSLIFMAGRFRGDEFDGPSRYLHVRGRLGFHGPYLVPPEDRDYSASDMHDVSVLQNLIISDFIKFGSNGYANSNRSYISMSLVGEMLAYGPDEILYADSIEKIARWNISLEGMTESIHLNEMRVYQACENVLNFPYDRPARTITPETYDHEAGLEIEYLPSPSGLRTVFGRVQFSGDANKVCLVRMNDDDGLIINMPVTSVSICAFDSDAGMGASECLYPDYYPSYYAMPPETKIISLAE